MGQPQGMKDAPTPAGVLSALRSSWALWGQPWATPSLEPPAGRLAAPRRFLKLLRLWGREWRRVRGKAEDGERA